MLLQNILEFDPSEYKYEIPTTNTQSVNLLVLATTGGQTLDQNEYISHTDTLYAEKSFNRNYRHNGSGTRQTNSMTVPLLAAKTL